MKILVIGGGGREHAMVWKLKQSASVEKLWCAPGNGGISNDAECLPADLKDSRALAGLAERLKADLTVVGPELPLACGVADEFQRRGLLLLGPVAAGARLEASKVFAKQFMERHGIPTARVYGVFEDSGEAKQALRRVDWPVVIKADGLCAGKGVLVASSREEAETFLDRAMERREFGDAGGRILLEAGLKGEELSYIILTDGERILPMASARDHKRAFDNDAGPNTGGMGAYSTDELLSRELERTIHSRIVVPALQGLRKDGIPYRGFLYFGLMLTAEGPQVLEFNCRMGDPETQALLLRANFDFADALYSAAQGKLKEAAGRWTPPAALCVVLASRGYPGEPETGKEIEGWEAASRAGKVAVFHAATRREGAKYFTTGGRVMAVSAAAGDLSSARSAVYEAVQKIRFDGMHFRSDIGSVHSTSPGSHPRPASRA